MSLLIPHSPNNPVSYPSSILEFDTRFFLFETKRMRKKDILNMLALTCFMVIYSANTYWASTTCQAHCSLPTVRW